MVVISNFGMRFTYNVLAPEDGFEPPTYGFGDHRSANWNYSGSGSEGEI